MSRFSNDEAGRDRLNKKLRLLVKPMPQALWTSDYHWGDLPNRIKSLAEGFGPVNMCPDYQRGHVWTPHQQRHYIENAMRNVLPASALTIQFNCANWETFDDPGELPRGFECIDGLQRFTAVQEWLAGNITPFDLTLEDIEDTTFDPRRMSYRFHVSVYAFRTRAEVLGHYLDLNAGGTQHSPEEISRVRTLLHQAKHGDRSGDYEPIETHGG